MKAFEELRRELWRLLDVLCDGGTLSDEERTRLNELLRHDERLRFEYLAYLTLDSTLARETDDTPVAPRDRWSDILLQDAIDAGGCAFCEAPEDIEGTAPSSPSGGGFFGGRSLLGFCIAILLLSGIVTIGYRSLPSNPDARSTRTATRRPAGLNEAGGRPASIAARLTRTHDCRWAHESISGFLGENLVRGQRLALKQGLAEVRFESGTCVFLEGPCVFEIEGSNSGRLHSGELTADVPEEAHGFTVFAPAMDVVDLGTRFAVSADANARTGVRVLSGKVRARWPRSSARVVNEEELSTGEAIEIDAKGNRKTDVTDISLPDRLPELKPAPLPPPIDPSLTWKAIPVDRPIIELGGPGSWDRIRADNPFVVVEHDRLYCFYKGLDKPESLGGIQRIGLATSVDGIEWNKPQDCPVLREGPDGAWDSRGVKLPMVYKYEGRYYLFYSGLGNMKKQIGLATSTDLLDWQKIKSNPILKARSDSWDVQLSTHPTPVFRRDGRFYLLHRGMRDFFRDQGLGLAVSGDLTEWKRAESSPIVPGAEEIYSFGCAVTSGGYVAISHSPGEPYWFSEDLVHWTKGPPAKFDLPDAETVSNPFYWRGEWNLLYERKDRVYRAVLSR